MVGRHGIEDECEGYIIIMYILYHLCRHSQYVIYSEGEKEYIVV